ARTATNIRAGARSPMAGIFHALFLLAFTLIAGKLLALVPMAALAAVLLMVAWGMSEYDRFIALVRTDPGERGVLVLTFLLTVFVDLTVAIGVGVTLAALLFMRRMSETAGLVAIDPAEEPELRDNLPAGVEVLRFTGPIFFGVANEMLEALRRAGPRTGRAAGPRPGLRDQFSRRADHRGQISAEAPAAVFAGERDCRRGLGGGRGRRRLVARRPADRRDRLRRPGRENRRPRES